MDGHRAEIRNLERQLTPWQRRIIRWMPRNVGAWFMEHGRLRAMEAWQRAIENQCDQDEAKDPLDFFDDLTPVRPPPMFLRK